MLAPVYISFVILRLSPGRPTRLDIQPAGHARHESWQADTVGHPDGRSCPESSLLNKQTNMHRKKHRPVFFCCFFFHTKFF